MIAANIGYAKIYKWVDEDGKVHFSDREDRSVEQEVVNVKPGASKWSRFDIRIQAVDVELSDEENRSRTFKTIKHEVSHSVVDTIVPYAPAWLNEGLAEQMEVLEHDQASLYFERHEDNRRVVAQAREQGRLAGIKQFLKLPSNKWRHSDMSGSSSLRAQAGQFLGFLLSKPTRRNFVVRLMHNFNRGDRTLAYYLVDDNYIGGVSMLDLDWRRWLHQQGKVINRL